MGFRVTRPGWLPLAFLTLIALSDASDLHAQFVTDPEKADSLRLRNGDWLVGDIREMTRGIVTYKTDAMSTIYVKWTRVLTATTNKSFQIYLDDESRHVGSLRASETLGRVVIRTATDTFEVATQSVVEMQRIKSSFWNRLDGSLDFGFGFTQQNAKTDLTLNAEVKYLITGNRFDLDLNGSFHRQDSATDITRGTARLTYAREIGHLWFFGVSGSVEQNSQLSLDLRGSIGAGPGRFLILNNRMELGTLLAVAINSERFADEPAGRSVPLGLITDFQFFNWSGLSTDLSSRLAIQPVLSDWGRWRISFSADITQEILNQLYLRVGLSELYDSRPPLADANQNDFTVTTSLGWTF
jgi:hypothetical protein